MFKVILKAPRFIPPFNEAARELRIQNTPLWLWQRNILAPYVTREQEIPSNARLPQAREPMLVYRDNLFFDQYYMDEFIRLAKKRGRPVRAAFSINDLAFREHALPLSGSYTPAGNLYLADLWYYPNGPEADVDYLVIDQKVKEAGYYHIPSYMAGQRGDLVFQVPTRGALIAIDSWVHIFIADIVFGQFARARRADALSYEDLSFKFRMLGKALYEGHQLLASSELVKIGKGCKIDPSAVIHGPTMIGDNVVIEAGVVIDQCIIGNNVNISQGCQLFMSVIGDGTFLPFRAALYFTTIMDNSMVAQNTCLQMCVIGRNTFIGAGSTFTDYNLIPAPIKALDGRDELKVSNRPVLGSAVGHNCRIGAGMIVYPARTIESDVVLAATKERRVIDKDVKYEDSDHHKMRNANEHKQMYPRHGAAELESW
jgi:UDP-N-acetylglucosamine diphosphorylase / glucose-1-phosphate thymidylyltransferase / UDP-N-acetylgalactosamine diphosphorylase / glucosamine-1-phosphate N-acetyltransferase / galactosamine-1-phosphate N-acetyltransferase